MRSGSPNEKVRERRAVGSGRSRPAATALRNSTNHSFTLTPCQTSWMKRAPVRSERAMFVNAATGSQKNIVPM